MGKRLRFKAGTIIRGNITNYTIVNKKDEMIGEITNYHWNRWTLETYEDIIWSRGCLQEVVDFMKELGGKP